MNDRLYEPMRVRRIQDASGSHIEPAFSSEWNHLDALCWKAGVVEADTGLPVRIYQGAEMRGGVPDMNTYGYSIGSGGGGAMSYRAMWTFLNGVSVGAEPLAVAWDEGWEAHSNDINWADPYGTYKASDNPYRNKEPDGQPKQG